MSVFTANMSEAATNSEIYLDLVASITVPDTVEPETDFDLIIEGMVEGGSTWGVFAYAVYENAEWTYNSNHMVSVSSGTFIEGSGFSWGSSIAKTILRNKPEGTYTFTFVFGDRSMGHGYYDVAVDITVTVECDCGCELTTDYIDAYIQGLADAAFKNNGSNRKKTFSNKLSAVQSMIDSGDYQSAINKLTHDIRAKVDGEGKNDWITDSQAQTDLKTLIDELIACLEAEL